MPRGASLTNGLSHWRHELPIPTRTPSQHCITISAASSTPAATMRSGRRWRGEVWRCGGRHAEAEALYREALELLDPTRSDDVAEIGVALNGLGALYVERGLEEGVALLERAVELRRRSAGPGLELTLNNLAIARRRFRRGSIAAVFPKRNRPDDFPGAAV